jgi:hypothetical protein
LFLHIISYTLSTTKLDIRAKLFLLGSKGEGGEGEKKKTVIKKKKAPGTSGSRL